MIFEDTEIFDPISDKKRLVKNIKRQAYTMPDKYGEEKSHDGVECVVIGKNREWKIWIPYRDFKKHNLELVKQL